MANKQLSRVAVVYGGWSAEAEVSRSSGRAVAAALRATWPEVIELELTREIGDALAESGAEVVFPVLHGPPGEDGAFQGFLDILGLPYVGSGVAGCALSMDKFAAKLLFGAANIRVAKDLLVTREDDRASAAERAMAELGPRVVVKPVSQGSALGVAFCRSADAVAEALAEAFRYDDRALIEQEIVGRELTVAVLEDDGAQALPPVEICTPPGAWYDFEHRYTPGLSEHLVPAPLDPGLSDQLCRWACAAHRVLGLRDLSRADFIVTDASEPVLLEVNALPGMTPTSLYPDAARAAGWTFEALVAHLTERALARGATAG